MTTARAFFRIALRLGLACLAATCVMCAAPRAQAANLPTGGERATLDVSGDGFLQVEIPTAAAGAGALVSNSGKISADGGLVRLSAAAAREMARHAINMSGVIEAKTVGGASGDVILAGSAGAVDVSGSIDATGDTATGDAATGGAITVTGRAITLTGARLDVSGATGGGAVTIGGGRQGSGELQHADTTTVDAASSIAADATTSGNGGNVVLWSDDLTTFAGTISAKGGAVSGDGGQVEVSGKALLSYAGAIDLSAAHGSFGTLLLDPYDVVISDGGASGFTASSDDSVINAATLLSALANADVTVSTGSGGSQAGNITVDAALSWSQATTLTLAAAGSIAIDKDITIAGDGGLALTYGDDLAFGDGASVSYTSVSRGGALSINGTGYTLLYSMADIAGINSDLTADYALATDLDASGAPYADSLVGDGDSGDNFTGVFEGLGHTISNLSISTTSRYVGLFSSIATGGEVRDIGLVNAAIVSTGGSVDYAGALAGYNSGTISGAFTTGSVSGDYEVGGLVGENEGTITDSHSGATTTFSASGYALVGGLVAFNGGGITDSYATGAVNGNSATYAGGLVGENYLYATIESSYAAGAVCSALYVGGLVGMNVEGTITSSHASGAVSGGAAAGGLVGYNSYDSSASIEDSYATGAVSGTAYVGGFAGYNYGSITGGYSIGAVTGSGDVGGFVGHNTDTGTLTDVGWDTDTSGLSKGIGADENAQSAKGWTTSALQDGSTASELGGGFTLVSGFYPYQTSLFPDGVLTISGYAYTDDGVTPLVSGASGTGLATVRFATGDAIAYGTGANGYYYAFVDKDDVAAGGESVLAYTTGATAGGVYVSKTTDSLVRNIYGGRLTETADDGLATLSALNAAYASAVAGTSASGLSFANRTIAAQATAFSIDEALSASGDLVLSVAGDLTIASGGGVSATNVSLEAPGAFVNAAGSSAVTAGGRWLIYSADSAGDAFDGLNSGNTAIWNTAAGGTVTAGGDRYVFACGPTETAAAKDAAKLYGVDGTTDPTAYYSLTGVATGVSGAYLGDSSVTLSGAAELSFGGCDALDASAAAGVYAYTLGLGTLSLSSGALALGTTSGSVTVVGRSITVTANSLTRFVGMSNPALTYTIGGDGLASGDSLTGALFTTADSGSPRGKYAITQGTLAAPASYSVTFISGTLTVAALTLADTSTMASVVTRGWHIDYPRAFPIPATSPLDLGGGGGESPLVFASPLYEGDAVCQGGESRLFGLSPLGLRPTPPPGGRGGAARPGQSSQI